MRALVAGVMIALVLGAAPASAKEPEFTPPVDCSLYTTAQEYIDAEFYECMGDDYTIDSWKYRCWYKQHLHKRFRYDDTFIATSYEDYSFKHNRCKRNPEYKKKVKRSKLGLDN